MHRLALALLLVAPLAPHRFRLRDEKPHFALSSSIDGKTVLPAPPPLDRASVAPGR